MNHAQPLVKHYRQSGVYVIGFAELNDRSQFTTIAEPVTDPMPLVTIVPGSASVSVEPTGELTAASPVVVTTQETDYQGNTVEPFQGVTVELEAGELHATYGLRLDFEIQFAGYPNPMANVYAFTVRRFIHCAVANLSAMKASLDGTTHYASN